MLYLLLFVFGIYFQRVVSIIFNIKLLQMIYFTNQPFKQILILRNRNSFTISWLNN